MADTTFYVRSKNGVLAESLTKEQILTLIEQVKTGADIDVDAGVITKIKEQNAQRDLSFWVGTQAEYNALEQKAENCFYIISNSGNLSELKALVDKNTQSLTELNENIDGIKTGIDAQMKQNNAKIEELVKKGGVIVEEYHEDKVHYYRFSNGLEIELGEYQKLTAYSFNRYGFQLMKIAEDNLISFNVSLSTSDSVRASEDFLNGGIIATVLRKINADGTIADDQTSLGVVYGCYIAFGLSGLSVSN